MLDMLEEELKSGKRNPEHEKQYLKYFETNTTPVRGTKITVRQDMVDKVERNYGFFALLSNDIKNPVQALEIYRNKDLIEKAFGDLKERLNMMSRTCCFCASVRFRPLNIMANDDFAGNPTIDDAVCPQE